jgi:hypothetical protein
MRGYETIEHFENMSDRIRALPWEQKKIRIVHELKKLGMERFEIEGELDGAVTPAEVRAIIMRLEIYNRTGRMDGLNNGRRLQRPEQAGVWRNRDQVSEESCSLFGFEREEDLMEQIWGGC